MDCASRAILYRIATGAPTQIAMRHWRFATGAKPGQAPPLNPLDGFSVSGMLFDMLPFGKGRPRKLRPTVENTPRIASPPHRGLAREEVVVVVDGREQRLAIVRQDRIHGQEAYWLCPRCGSARMHLFLLNGEIGCRRPGCLHPLGLSYTCRLTRNRAALRARKLRRKLGAAASLLAPLPPRPRNVWAAARYDRLARELAICEAALAQRLRDMVGRRRKQA